MLSKISSWKRLLFVGLASALLILIAAIDFDSAFAGKKNKGGGGGGGGGVGKKSLSIACPPGFKASKSGCKPLGGSSSKSQAKKPSKTPDYKKISKEKSKYKKQDWGKSEPKHLPKSKPADKYKDYGKSKSKSPAVVTTCSPPMVYSRKARGCVVGKSTTAGKEKAKDYGKAKESDVASKCHAPLYYSKRAKACIPGDFAGKDKDKDHGKGHGKDVVIVKCHAPMVYSRKAKGCVPGKDKGPDIVKCHPPLYWSHKAKRCVDEPQIAKCYPPKVYSRRAKACVRPDHGPEIASCNWPRIRVGYGCVCAPGFLPVGGHCIVPVLPVGPVPVGPPTIVAGPPPPPVLQPRPGVPPGPAAPAPQPRYEPRPEPVAASTNATCLPDDLYDLMQETYGIRPGLSRCPPPCMPKPSFFTPAELDAVAEKGGLEWCEDCLQVGGYMPLASIRLLEQVANMTVCVNPDMCRVPAGYGGQGDIGEREVEIHTIYKDLPKGIDNEGNIAVVIGNRDYQGELPVNADGHADADAVVTLLTDQLGYTEDNIIDLRDATLADLEQVFGSADNPGGELAERIDDDDPADVFIYIASHGLVDEEDTKKVYLLPVDARLDDLDDSAYPLQELFQHLGKTGARTTMLMLEANFARNLDELIDPPNLPELEVEAMPAQPVPGLAVFKASDRDQKTIQDPEYGIGLFTRYLIEGLAGKADETPIGNGDNQIDTVELFVYTADQVRTTARKSFGMEQKPLLSEIDNLVVGKLASN